MTCVQQDQYSISGEYFKQHRLYSTKIDLMIEDNFSFDQLKHVLKYGSAYQDFNFLDLLFNNTKDREMEEPADINQIEINEKLSGQSLTHLTLHFSSAFFNDKQLGDLLESLDLCPNLVYLKLSFNDEHSQFDLGELSENILKLTELRTLIVYLQGFTISKDKLLTFANRISKLRNLLELDLDLDTDLKNIYEFQKEFSQHKVLNTLKIKGINQLNNINEISIIGSTFLFRKIKRLVQQELSFANPRHQNFWEEYDININLFD